MTNSGREKLTLEAFISAPRRSSATPNNDGTLALYSVSTYSFDSHSEGKEIRVLDLKSGTTTLFSDDVKNKECDWLDTDEILWLREAEGGSTELWSGRTTVEDRCIYHVGTIPGPVSNIKTKKLSVDSFAVVVTSKASKEGRLYNSKSAEKSQSSAKIYDNFPVRVWDLYVSSEKNSIWYATIQRSNDHKHKYSLTKSGFTNALIDTELEHPNPDPLIGVDFDISTTGILFTAADPLSDRALTYSFDLYYIPLITFQEYPAPKPQKISVLGYNGISSSPIFSPDGKSAAFLKTKDPIYDDIPRIFIIDDIHRVDKITEIFSVTEEEKWDLQPTKLEFGIDANEIYLTANQRGDSTLFQVPVTIPSRKPLTAIPAPLTDSASVSSIHAISPSQVLITTSSHIDSSTFTVIDPKKKKSRVISSLTKNGSTFGLDSSQISSIKFRGAGDYDVQAYIIRPSSFRSDMQYPMLFWIHGGPVSAWPNAWSTRWNPVVFAEQGYVIVACNFTGSLGFGQDFVNGIKTGWGGRAYEDLVECFNFVRNNCKYIDTQRSVAMGGSYGGYMINWIAGHPFASSFRALVNHDGIFSLPSLITSDEPSSAIADFHGALWENRAEWDKWDPSRYAHNWNTPMMVIHSDKDYRCPVTEGLAAFYVCQGKGIQSRFLTFEDENHFVLNRENSLVWYKEILKWCDSFCKVERNGSDS